MIAVKNANRSRESGISIYGKYLKRSGRLVRRPVTWPVSNPILFARGGWGLRLSVSSRPVSVSAGATRPVPAAPRATSMTGFSAPVGACVGLPAQVAPSAHVAPSAPGRLRRSCSRRRRRRASSARRDGTGKPAAVRSPHALASHRLWPFRGG